MADPWDLSHASARRWRAEAWSLELRDDEVADLSYEGRRVLRSIRAVVRDRNWSTATWTVDDVALTADTVTIRVRTRDLGADISGTVVVSVQGSEVSVEFDGVSHSVFDTNRAGLVVLHPPQLAGAALTVTHADGSSSRTAFPIAISPHQPVFDIAALAWEHDGLEVDVRFAGDAFEMEDQRNWTDASYKTYSRPLALPFPYRLEAGEHITQSVRVSVRQGSAASPGSGTPADTIVLRSGGTFPEISVAASTAPSPAPRADAVGRTLLVELDLATPTWRAALARAAGDGLPLDVRLVLGDDDAGGLDAVADALRGVPLARIAAFQASGAAAHVSDVAATAALRDALSRAGVTASVVGGVRSHFTELNREQHRLPRDLAGIVFGVTPLFHSLDTEQLIESVAMQRLVAAQAVELAAGAPVHVGPVTLRPRFNNVATTAPTPAPFADLRVGYGPELIGATDARQASPALAAWAVASAAALAVPGVASLSFFEQWGPRGIVDAVGRRYPVAAAIEALVALDNSAHDARPELLWGQSPDGLIWALGARSLTDVHILAANIGDTRRTVRIEQAGSADHVILDPHGYVLLNPSANSAAAERR